VTTSVPQPKPQRCRHARLFCCPESGLVFENSFQFMVRLMFPLAVVAGAAPVMAKDVVPVTVTLNVPDCDAWLVAVPR